MAREIILPKLGQTMEEGAIVEWLKQEGESVDRGDVLFTVESDKATLEVEAPARGVLRRILVPAGEDVPVLTVVGLITKTTDEDISAYEAGAPVPPQAGSVAEAEAPATVSDEAEPAVARAEVHEGGRIFVSPRARKLASENGVDVAEIRGTGPNGRIVERDVVAFMEAVPKATPVARRLAAQAGVDLRELQGTGAGGRISKEDVERAIAGAPAAPAPVLEMPAVEARAPAPLAETEVSSEVTMTGVRGVIARRMLESHQITAAVTLTTEVDATAFVALREQLKVSLAKELGFNVGYNDLMIKVAARGLREMPYMNARLESTGGPTEGTIRRLKDVHVALAVDTERGLLVPVVRDADRKGVAEIARDVRALVERARTGTAAPDELSGSTFTITNLGMHEIDAFTPIINLPETAILGVGRIKPKPVVVDGEICVRQMVWLSLTFDHRLVDGAPAARFLQRIKQLIEAPYLLLA